ncbi:MAG: YceI family protein [Ignavibacteriae bacterium]|nr:YceI family protein [Ignavibacteriota bacterium]
MQPFKKHIVILLLVAASSICSAQEQDSVPYILLQGSKLWLEGSSTINTFSCGTESVVGFGRVSVRGLDRVRTQGGEPTSPHTNSIIEVSIPVMTLDCGNSSMNDDLREAMKSASFPYIRYRFLEAKPMQTDSELSPSQIFNTLGEITIAGITNRIEIPVKAEALTGGRFRLTGNKAPSMLDFNITPPTAFFGLIKAHDKLVVHFELLVGPEDLSTDELTRAGDFK